MIAKVSKIRMRHWWLPAMCLCLFFTLGMGQCERAQEDPQLDQDFDSQVENEATPDPNMESAGFEAERRDSAIDEKIRDIVRQHLPPPACGNGVLEFGEQCEDGNTTSGDLCSSTCQKETAGPPVCGNNVWESGEQCDDGNQSPGDGCDASCQIEFGGPGFAGGGTGGPGGSGPAGGSGSGTGGGPGLGTGSGTGSGTGGIGPGTAGSGTGSGASPGGATGPALGSGTSGGGGLGINIPPPVTNEGCASAAGTGNPNCSWALLGMWGMINTPFINFTGMSLYSYDDDGNPYQQITTNSFGEPVQIIFNVFDPENRPLYHQDIHRANPSVPGPLNVMSFTFQSYLTGGAYAGEPENKLVVTLDNNTQTLAGPGQTLPGILVNAFQYDYTDPNFVPAIENNNVDAVALTNPGMRHPMARNTIFEGHQKDADGNLQRILKGFRDSSFNFVRYEDLYFMRHTSGPDAGKIDMLVLNYTNCAEDPTGLHCQGNSPLMPYNVMHGVIHAKYAYDSDGRLSGITFEERKNPGPGQPVDQGVDYTIQCSIEYWDNPYNLSIHRLPQVLKDLGFSETGLLKAMMCMDPASMQQTFGRQGFFITFMWQPLWAFIPTAEIPQ